MTASGIVDWARIEFLQREAHQHDVALRSIEAQMVTILLGSITAGTATAVALVEYAKFDILLTIPVLLPLVWLTGTRLLTELYALAGQRRAVEAAIRDDLRQFGADGGYRPWEEFAGRAVVRSWANVALFAWFGSFSLLLGLASV